MENVEKMNNKIYVIILNIFAIALIVFVSAMYIGDSYGIKIVGDEFGYWSSAAWLSGCDWREVASHNDFYGYGYGLLLYFIFSLDLGNRMTYQLALCVNVLMMVCMYGIAYKFIKKIANQIHIVIRVLIALVSVLYMGVLFYTQYTMAEILICLLNWIIIYNVYCLLERYSRVRFVITTLILVYCFFVHQRLIGLVIVGSAMLIYIVIKHKKSKELLWIIPTFVIIFALFYTIKIQYKNNFLSYTDTPLIANEFQGQKSKLLALMSSEGIILFLIGIIGKLFYACSGTFLLFAVFMVALGKELITCIKNKKISRNLEIWMFIFLVCLASIIISTIFLLDFRMRFDLLIYGRYFDFTISPILVFALTGMVKNDNKFKIEMWMFVVYIILAWIVSINIPYDAPKDITYFMCPAISYVLYEYDYSIGAVGVLTLLIASIIKMMYERKNQTIFTKSISIVVVIFLWIGCFISQYNIQSRCFMPEQTTKDEILAKQINEIGVENNLYFYAEDKKEYICFLQFIMRNHPIHVFTNESDVYDLKDTDYLLTVYKTELFNKILDMHYEQVAASDSVILWKRVDE